MKLVKWLVDLIFGIFLLFSWLAGVWIQLYRNFYIGLLVVILTLFVDVARQARVRKKKFSWLGVVGWGFSAAVSIAVLAVTILLALYFEERVWYIILLNSALSFLAFSSGAFMRAWMHWKR